MRNIKTIFVIICLALLSGFAALSIATHKPRLEYMGEPLAYWLRGYTNPDSAPNNSANADLAVKSLGTNAIPVLLEQLRARDSIFKVIVNSIAENFSVCRGNFFLSSDVEKNNWSLHAFEALGSSGRSAAPELVRLYQRHLSDYSMSLAASALASIGPEAKCAIPALIKNLDSTNFTVRLDAANALGAIHQEPEIVLPQLTKMFASPDPQTRRIALQNIACFSNQAASAIPAMMTLCNDPDPGVRSKLATVLSQVRESNFDSASATMHLPPQSATNAMTSYLDNRDPMLLLALAGSMYEMYSPLNLTLQLFSSSINPANPQTADSTPNKSDLISGKFSSGIHHPFRFLQTH